jgi:hypothetical protein
MLAGWNNFRAMVAGFEVLPDNKTAAVANETNEQPANNNNH